MDNVDRIAVIIPVYNVTSFLEETIASAVSQDYADKEIIVIDDGSSEEAAMEIKRICIQYNITLLHHSSNRGPAAARNTGLEHTRAELILFLDGDDVLLPGTIQYFADAMRKNPSAVATYARVRFIFGDGSFTPKPPEPALERMVSGNAVLPLLVERKLRFSNGAICFRRQALEKTPSEYYNLRAEELWILSCHLALLGEIAPAGDRIVLHRRMHTCNIAYATRTNPALIFPTFDKIYDNPIFMAAIGKERLSEIREKTFAKANFYAATKYAEKTDVKNAATYFNNLSMSLSTIFSDVKG